MDASFVHFRSMIIKFAWLTNSRYDFLFIFLIWPWLLKIATTRLEELLSVG